MNLLSIVNKIIHVALNYQIFIIKKWPLDLLPDFTIATIATDKSTRIVNILKNPMKDTKINMRRLRNPIFDPSVKYFKCYIYFGIHQVK